ncbi:DUF1003 domain-containing protein [Polymorphobacter sp. PAMC 29334]|uniref:DUF1003 domain-containing protein n=1 Tax=Polymorphobacter sp. PAMC 29334 TaxID=2862331 RepID=UPI001C7650FE|nr:DUF1003 domain-containing protein [Polymorphobacter sp. PAMC 29334]QYE35474.1 DUF1003 domain-containing protein [Polymorphobacter sp. PAMC 29334]
MADDPPYRAPTAAPLRPPRVPPGEPSSEEHGLSAALARNIEAVARRRAEDAASLGFDVRLATGIGRRIGRMSFVYLHILFYGTWTLLQYGVVGHVAGFDPALALMGSIASAEAIFLSLFILIAQNILTAADNRRDDLALQVSLLAEHEVTQLIKLTRAVAEKLGIDTTADHGEIADLQDDVAPERVLDQIAGTENAP